MSDLQTVDPECAVALAGFPFLASRYNPRGSEHRREIAAVKKNSSDSVLKDVGALKMYPASSPHICPLLHSLLKLEEYIPAFVDMETEAQNSLVPTQGAWNSGICCNHEGSCY